MVFILFQGGFSTKRSDFNAVALPAGGLATWGVVLTALATFVVLYGFLKWPLDKALLLAAIISSTDAAPFFRVFNPTLQGTRFDPDGEYVRRYVPELRDLVGPSVHEPWKAAGDLFAGAVTSYPPPIVDHAAERDEALERYKQR